MRVLIIEDDAEQARLMQRTLERAGYVVDLAGTGDAGLALYEAGPYDVLLIDDQMPGPGGLEVLRTIATRGALPPTIMITGHGAATLAMKALHLGASDYLITDVDGRYLTLLPMVVARVLHQQRLLAEKRQAEEQFRALFEAAPDAMILVNADGRMVRVNAQVERLFGYARHEVLGGPVHLLVPERLRARHQQHLQGYCATPSLRPMGSGLALYGRRKDGSEVPVEISLSPLRTAEGLLVVSAIRDVTARQEAERAQRAEEALRQHLEWLTTTLSSIGDAVLATDTAGTMTFLNPVAAHLTGWPASDALGQPIETVLRLCHVQTHQVLEGLVQRVLCTGAIVLLESETLLVTRHGQELPVRASAAPIRGLQGTPQGVVMVVRDISEYKALEDQLRHAQKMEAIGTLAGGIAHDFNNLLAAILGFTELALADVPQASRLWHHLHQVLAAGTRAKDLVHQILAFSRKTLTARIPLTLPTLVQEAFVLLRASLPATITIRTHITKEVGAVLADATQVHQVLLNLCANAAYAMRTTGGVLEVRLEAVEVKAPLAVVQATLEPGSYVQLTVRDTGQGMAPDVVERIFEPYFTTKPPGEGSGMGLAVVHGIITQHGGGIAVTSVPGHGTTCTIYLPRLAETAPDCPTPAEEPLPGGTERLLFVDDEPAIAALGQEFLTRLGYQVVVCGSSLEALATFRATTPPFDLVITDQTMPQLTGDALARALRQLRPDLPVILCTGFSHTVDAERARALGITAVVTKPWQGREFAQTIRRVLDQHGAARHAPAE